MEAAEIEAFEGTSATQYSPAGQAVVVKDDAKGQDTAQADVQAISSTNVNWIYWAQHRLRANGTHRWHFGFPSPVFINQASQIAVSMTEIDNQGRPFMVDAFMQVFNVVPHSDGTVTVRFRVDHPHQLRVLFNFIIVN